MSLQLKIVIVLVALAVAAGLILSTEYLQETLRLPPRTIGYLAALLVAIPVVAILWSAALREWARRPDGSDSRKNGKQNG
jgi:hypothetical protein